MEMKKETSGIQSQMVIIIIIIIMHLSMLSPRVVGGGAHPGEYNIFTRARVKFLTPGSVLLIRQ